MEVYVDAPSVPYAITSDRVELRLRQSGILVDSTALHALRIACIALDDKDHPAVPFTCSTAVDQPVDRIAPTPLILRSAVVWQTPMVVSTIGANRLTEGLREQVDAQLTRFLNAWFKVNPK